MDCKVFVIVCKFMLTPMMLVFIVFLYIIALSGIFGVQDAKPSTDLSSAAAEENSETTTTSYEYLPEKGSRSQRNLQDTTDNAIKTANFIPSLPQNLSSDGVELFFEVIKIRKRQNNSLNALKSEIINEEESLSTENQILVTELTTESAASTTESLETTTVEMVTSRPGSMVKNLEATVTNTAADIMITSEPEIMMKNLQTNTIEEEILNKSSKIQEMTTAEMVTSTPGLMVNNLETTVTNAAADVMTTSTPGMTMKNLEIIKAVEVTNIPDILSNSSKILETTPEGAVTSMPEMMGTPVPLVGTHPGKKKLQLGDPLKLPVHGCPKFCQAGENSNEIGSCMTVEECHKRGGTSAGSCCGRFFVCCKIVHYCGDTSSERLVNFRSADYPEPSRGSMACDFDLLIEQDVCAVRVEFVHARFHEKMGGICDVDQVLILNSVDGATSSQCGDLTGYATTVAVTPGQEKPLKIVVISQNDGFYLWDMRLRQIQCRDLSHFKKPLVCGSKIAHDPAVSFYQLLDLWKNKQWHTSSQYPEDVWWREPGPSYNRFYYGTTRKALLQGPQIEDLAEDRIIGGNDADLHEFPWQVAIVLKRVFFCGGSLINDEYVLSAAHCFLTHDTPVADLVVFLGDHDLTSSNDTFNDIRGVKQVHYHAHFHALLLSNDIAMLQLDRPVAFSQRIRPVCLPKQGLPVLGLIGKVAGWGISSYPNGKPNAILQKLDVQIMSNEFCVKALDEDLGPGNLCAVPTGHKGTCFGDSGGPLTIQRNGKETLVGIISFGIAGCAVTPGMPDLYTRVSEYLQWVDISAINYLG